MAGYGTLPRSAAAAVDLRRVPLVSRPAQWRRVLTTAMVVLAAIAIIFTATHGPAVEGSLRRAVDLEAIRDDPTFNPHAHSDSLEPHHKGSGPQTVYFHNDRDRGHDDESYIASLAAGGADIEQTARGAVTQRVDDHSAVVEHRAKQDQRQTFHKTIPDKDAPEFDDNANIMEVLHQYEKQVESASTHLEKLDHAEQTEAASTKGEAQTVEKVQSSVNDQIQELHTEVGNLEDELEGVEEKLQHNDDVMTKLETVMEDVYYEENDDHSRLKTISHASRKQDLKEQYTAPSPWATDNTDDESDKLDDYYYVAPEGK